MAEFEEKNEQTTETHQCKCSSSCDWAKMLLLTAAVFAGTFFAVYFVADQAMNRAIYRGFPMPGYNHHMMNKLMRDGERDMRNFEKDFYRNEHMMKDFERQIPPITYLEEYDKGYKLIIDLKHFNNDINNIKLDINADRVSILGATEKDDKNSVYSLNYSQTYKLGDKINAKNVTKEVTGGKAIVYLPFLDD